MGSIPVKRIYEFVRVVKEAGLRSADASRVGSSPTARIAVVAQW